MENYYKIVCNERHLKHHKSVDQTLFVLAKDAADAYDYFNKLPGVGRHGEVPIVRPITQLEYPKLEKYVLDTKGVDLKKRKLKLIRFYGEERDSSPL